MLSNSEELRGTVEVFKYTFCVPSFTSWFIVNLQSDHYKIIAVGRTILLWSILQHSWKGLILFTLQRVCNVVYSVLHLVQNSFFSQSAPPTPELSPAPRAQQKALEKTSLSLQTYRRYSTSCCTEISKLPPKVEETLAVKQLHSLFQGGALLGMCSTPSPPPFVPAWK